MILLAMMIGTASATPIQIYGTWHCGNDACTWATVRDMTDFDAKNHWIIDRGDGVPSVNLVVLAFVNPLKLLNRTNDAGTVWQTPASGQAVTLRTALPQASRVVISTDASRRINVGVSSMWTK